MRFLGLFSKLGFEPDFDQPNTEKAVNRLISKINQDKSYQDAAASSGPDFIWMADFAGVLGDLFVVAHAAPAAGESMTYDVQKNGVSILTAPPFSVSSTTVVTDQISLYSACDPTKLSFAVGDVFRVVRVYAAGGAPTPMGPNELVLEPTVKRWK